MRSTFQGMRLALLALALAACSSAPSSSTASQELVAADAGQDAGPAWCTPLLPYQTACHSDPSTACTERNGTTPASAYECGEPSPAPAGCTGFPSPSCSTMIYCCDR